MRSEIKNISGKLDALAVSIQETKDESNFRKLIHKPQPKRSTKNLKEDISLKVYPTETNTVLLCSFFRLKVRTANSVDDQFLC